MQRSRLRPASRLEPASLVNGYPVLAGAETAAMVRYAAEGVSVIAGHSVARAGRTVGIDRLPALPTSGRPAHAPTPLRRDRCAGTTQRLRSPGTPALAPAHRGWATGQFRQPGPVPLARYAVPPRVSRRAATDPFSVAACSTQPSAQHESTQHGRAFHIQPPARQPYRRQNSRGWVEPAIPITEGSRHTSLSNPIVAAHQAHEASSSSQPRWSPVRPTRRPPAPRTRSHRWGTAPIDSDARPLTAQTTRSTLHYKVLCAVRHRGGINHDATR